MTTKEIVKQMTLEEKAHFLTGGGNMETYTLERLGLEPWNFSDGPHGVRIEVPGSNCTMFPNLCNVGATWDKELVYELGNGLAKDCLEHNIQMLLAPGINIKRHILCGRNFEYFAEDPILAGELGAAYINGMQDLGVGTSLKHFAMNNQETFREYVSVEADERTIREIYLKGFEIAVKKANPTSVMCAYNKIFSRWCSENSWLLKEVLKKEWGYDGFVISDWGAVHDSCKAVKGGTDLRMPHHEGMVEDIVKGVENGELSMEDIDDAVERVINFVNRAKPEKLPYDRNEQHKLAAKVAAGGVVLLKNEGNILPLTSDKYKTIGVVGEFADKPLVCGQGSAEVNVDPAYIDSPLTKLRELLPETDIEYKEFYKKGAYSPTMLWPLFGEFWHMNTQKDVVVMFIGSMESEDSEYNDRRDAHFNANYGMFIDYAKRIGKRVVIVIQSGSAMLLGPWKDKVDAIVEMWLGGEGAGTAIAEVLTGKVNPSGKLPETFPKEMRKDLDYPGNGVTLQYKEGMDVGYRYYDKHPEEILYPFGHGLSYTEFKYEDISAKQDGDKISLSFTLSNVGDCDGAEVAQIYVSDPVCTVYRPVKELKAFEKIFLKKGESKKVEINLPVSDLAFYNPMMREWITEHGNYEFLIGSSSQDIRLTATVNVKGNSNYTMTQYGESMIG